MAVERIQEKLINPTIDRDLARLSAFRLPGVISQQEHLWRAGKRRNYYIDIDPILNDPAECQRVVEWFTNTIQSIGMKNPFKPIDFLGFVEKKRDAGGTVGALRLAGAVSILTTIPHVVVRLSKEIPTERIKFPSTPDSRMPANQRFVGANFAVITDHCSGGDEALRAITTIEDNGGTVGHLLTYSLIEPEFKMPVFKAKGIDVHWFLTAPYDLREIDGFGFAIKQR